MLVFKRRRGEKFFIYVGDRTVEVVVVDGSPARDGGGWLKIGVTAPDDVKILRGELVGPDETVEEAMRRGRD